jgi:hypothetical protein
MSIVLQSTGGGSITINEPTTASNFTQSLPAATGTVMVSGNQPAFSAYLAANQTITSTTYTKIQFNTEVFDTANAYDNATNYRFQPAIAGYYQISGAVSYGASVSINRTILNLYKNGISYAILSDANGNLNRVNGSVLLYLNGTTDYVEIYGYINGTTVVNFDGGQNLTYFTGCLTRTA